MSEYIVTLADNGYVVESNGPAMRLVYGDYNNETGSVLPLAMMRELLADLEHAIEIGGSGKYKVKFEVENI